MKILWITNIVFPEAQNIISGCNSIKGSGGWLIGLAEVLIEQPGIELAIGCVSRKVHELTFIKGKRIHYYLLPYGKGNKKINHDYDALWRRVKEEYQPDVVHLHGTEMTHGLSYLDSCGTNNVCVSIQGLVSIINRYYYSGLSRSVIYRYLTPASLIRGNIIQGAKALDKKGVVEREIIKRVSHIIGRTSWDRSQVWAINPKAIYHKGQETLRPEFYLGDVWRYDKCHPHSIFLSQANYPYKGLHMILRALPLVLRHFPDTTVHIAGDDITKGVSWKNRFFISNYGNIIRHMIYKNGLDNVIEFVGKLDGENMKKEYLRSNVFICPSSIENSPNSLGEAQILGVPVLSSYVGGVMDMMRDNEDNMYRYEEVEMLAFKIVQLFEKKGDVDTEQVRKNALMRHNPESNVRDLLSIYNEVTKPCLDFSRYN